MMRLLSVESLPALDSRRPRPLRRRYVLVLPASISCRHPCPHPCPAARTVAALVLGPPTLLTPRMTSGGSIVRLQQATTEMLCERLQPCRHALAGSSRASGPSLSPRRSQPPRGGGVHT